MADNTITVVGNLTRDPEIRYTAGGQAKATLGVRPEDIHIAGPSDPADLCMEAEVEVTEQLGSEIVLDTRVGKAAIVASVDPTSKVRVHDKLKLALNPARDRRVLDRDIGGKVAVAAACGRRADASSAERSSFCPV